MQISLSPIVLIKQEKASKKTEKQYLDIIIKCFFAYYFCFENDISVLWINQIQAFLRSWSNDWQVTTIIIVFTSKEHWVQKIMILRSRRKISPHLLIFQSSVIIFIPLCVVSLIMIREWKNFLHKYLTITYLKPGISSRRNAVWSMWSFVWPQTHNLKLKSDIPLFVDISSFMMQSFVIPAYTQS